VISSREEYGMHILSIALPKDAMRVEMERNVHGQNKPLPVVIFGHLFCLGQCRLNRRREEMSLPYGI
jgi:hypothetical protein